MLAANKGELEQIELEQVESEQIEFRMAKVTKSKAEILHQKDEKALKERLSRSGQLRSEIEMLKLVHELEIHEIELERQIKELKLAVDRGTTATSLYDYSPTAQFTLEIDGTISQINHNGARILGKSRSELINTNFKQFVSHETESVFTDFLKKAVDNNSEQECEVNVAINENSFISVYLVGFGLINEQKCLVTANDFMGHNQAKDDIFVSLSRLRRAELASKTGNLEIHMDSQKIYASDGAIKLYGVQKDQFDYSDIKKITLAEYRPLLDLALKNLIEENIPYDVEFKIRAQDTGEIKDIHSIATYDIEKGILFGSIQDITENKTMQNRIYESELYYRTMIETSPDAIVIVDTTGQVQFASQGTSELFLLPTDSLIGTSISQWIAPEMHESAFNRFKDIISGIIKPTSHEYKILRSDSTTAWLEIHASRLQNAAGQTHGLFLICRDISERKKTEKALQLAHDELQNLHDNLDEAIFSFDPVHNRMLQASKAHEVIFGCPISEFFKNPRLWYELIIPEDKPIVDRGFPILSSGKNLEQEYRIIRPDGQLRWIGARMRPTLDQEGKLVQIDGIAHDITNRKQAEEQNRESEERFRMVFENVFDGIVIYDEDPDPFKRKLIECNEQYAKMVGRSREELINIGYTHELQISHEESSNENRLESLSLKKAYKGSYSWIRPDGKDNVIEYIGVPIMWRGKSYSIGIDRDITVRTRTEEETKKSLSLLTATLESTADGILVVNNKGKITHFNKKFIELWRIPPTNCSTWNEEIEISFVFDQLKDPESFLKKIKEMELNDNESSFDILEFKDGRTFERYSQPQTIEGKTFGRVWNFRDITERKSAEAELIAAMEKAEESDRLKSAFLANMSHEVRTPLNSIIGFSKLLTDPTFDEEQKNEFIQLIQTNGNNLITIITDIMDISKLESGQITIRKTQINAQKFISSVKEQFSYLAEVKKLELKIMFSGRDKETVIFADAERLSQIFNNLLSNAIKFTKHGHIEIGYYTYNQLVEFYVKDTGIGIPKEFHKKIFDRFRQVENSTTREYGGNGLGLAISKNLIELMGGKIWVESEYGKGSAFYFTLPTL